MKKLLYLFSATLLVLTSCTDDYAVINQKGVVVVPETPLIPDAPVVTDSTVVVESNLVKKIVHTFQNGTISVIDLLYDGNKIISETDQGGYKTNYTYTGELITKIEKADETGTVYLSKEYNYEGGKLMHILRNEFGSYYKRDFTYNKDGTIWYSEFMSDSEGNEFEPMSNNGTYTILNDNLIKNQLYFKSNQVVQSYEYDSKKSPKSNIIGFNKVLDIDYEKSANNPIKIVKVMGSQDNLQTSVWSANYEYNANGYATIRIEKIEEDGSVFVETTQFYY